MNPHPGNPPEPEDTGRSSKDRERSIEIEVNGKPVVLNEKDVTGADIKAAAIAQGVLIQMSFVLQLEQPNGTSKVIGNTDPIRVHQKMSFTAIAADDNS